MKSRQRAIRAALLLLTCMAASGTSQAQTASTSDLSCPRTRAEVRDECVAFLKTHVWSEADGDWVSNATGKRVARLPEGVTPRAKVRAERDAFLRANRWNEATSQWEPIVPRPRELSRLSRAEMKAQTIAFMRTHQWDENSGAYVDRVR